MRNVERAATTLTNLLVQPSARTRWAAVPVIAAGLTAGTWIVAATGGARFAGVHTLYLAVIGAALVFAWFGGLLAGLVAGLLVGPWMPLDTSTGEPQGAVNWIDRMVFFCVVGVLVGVGVSMLRRRMAMLSWLRDHDAKTGLLTHDGLVRELDERLAGRGLERQSVAVAQLNNLLDIQNTFGPEFADRLVSAICRRARDLVPAEYPMALLQGDRIGVVVPARTQTATPARVIEQRIRDPYRVDGVPIYVDFAFGAATFPQHGATAEQLLQKASIAMHLAVHRGAPSLVYDSATDQTNRDNLLLLGMLPGALASGELSIWHQAKVELATGAVVGTEALLRWCHPERGLIPPGQFLPQAESSPLINDLTRWVIDAAADDQASLSARGHDVAVSINLSVRNLYDPLLLHSLDQAVQQHGIEPGDLELELTESSVVNDFDECARIVAALRDRGYGVSIDDFGTGHTSLAYLKQLPITTLKIDQSFVRHLATDDADRVIVRSVVDLAGSLGLVSVAEGVEDDEAIALLRDWGCTYAQGFGFHRPCPYEEFVDWLERQPRAAPRSNRRLVASR